MFFTQTGRMIAYFGFFFGMLGIGLGLLVVYVSGDMATNEAMAREYFAARNAGEMISRGMTIVLVSVTLGILCEISGRIRGTRP
ncbi:MAG: hypothetical protein Q4G25_10160 [Paracoccus sp. (in: a-proteobacteria)]|nr:hypothetical protein [Paracoccus sp. (in: a-proteobacteria)]